MPGRALLLMGLLLSAHSELRARDPEVEQEDEGATEPRGFAEAVPLGSVPKGSVPQGSVPPRSGNWCAFVQKRVLTTAVMSGTEQYTAKSQSPCPSGVPDCQLVMYKLSVRPIYRQTPRLVTALLWQCCPGHTGHNCDDSVSSGQLSSTYSGHSKDPSPQHRSEERPEHMDPHQEQNDHQGGPYHTSSSHNTPVNAFGSDHAHHPHRTSQLNPTHQPDHSPPQHHTIQANHAHSPDHAQQPGHARHTDHVYRSQEQHTLDPNPHPPITGERPDFIALRYQDTPAVLPVPHMMALIMSQLQPILEAFNRSLAHMQSHLSGLALDVAQLKAQASPELQATSVSMEGLQEDEDRLEQVYQDLRETQDQLQHQRHLLDSHRASLLTNLTRLKTDMDVRFREQENVLQVKVQALNLSMAELWLHQKPPSSALTQGSETSALWRAIERLDDRVVNNTVKVQELAEDVEVTAGSVQQLHQLHQDQDKRINTTSRRSQVQFMETGLEVEAAKVTVLRRVEELSGNLSLQGQRLTELDVDVDYLYTVLYKHNSSSGNCGCDELKTSITHLQKELANITELANENRMALEESEGQAGAWGYGDSHPALEALQKGFQQMKLSWASKENRTRAIEHNLASLGSSLVQCQTEVSLLQQTEAKRIQENRHLRSSFNSLLKDGIRHSDVLELLLGEEVLEFLDWTIHDQEAHSIPALKERLRHHEEELRMHNQSISLLLENTTGPEEIPAADQPSPHHRPLTEWPSGDSSSRGRGTAREHQVLHGPQLRDGSDLWKLEQAVGQLQHRVEILEGKQNSSRERDPRLWDEVLWLKRGLEDHLRDFKNIFSNTDRLVISKQTLELDKVLELVKTRQRKRAGTGGTH